MRFIQVTLLFTILNLSCSTKEKEQFDLVILNGNIIHLETGTIDSTKTIFISDGKIKKIEQSEHAPSYSSKKTVDVKGKFVLPGFWDNHTHFRGGDSLIKNNKNFLKLFIANGITTVRDAGGDLTSAVIKWNNEVSAGELVGPNIYTSGPKIDGKNATWAGSLEVDSDLDIQKALDSLENIPTDYVKIYDSKISGKLYLKTIIEAEKRNLITSGHMPFTVSLDETVASGIDAIEHLYYVMKGCASNEKEVTKKLQTREIGFWDAMPLLMSHYQDSTARNTFENLKKNKVFVVPTLHIGDVLSHLDEVDHSNDHYLKYMGTGIIKTYEGRITKAALADKKEIQDRKDLEVFFSKLTKALDQYGVLLLAGSDSGAFNSYTYPGISLHKELQEMVASGISPLNALKTSAYNGSKFLQKDSDYGTIANKKAADLVILNANPLENIEHTEDIFSVVKAGKIYSREDLKTLLKNAVQN